MKNSKEDIINETEENGKKKGFFLKRIIIGVVILLAGLWLFGTLLDFFKNPSDVTGNKLTQDSADINKRDHKENSDSNKSVDSHNIHDSLIIPKPGHISGIAFTKALIAPIDYELTKRFWGWRPNDIIDLTDNVNNFQLGALEVTRRTLIIITENISRTGTTASFDLNLERAMNWFMVKAERYWFPSPESKYRDGLDELAIYIERLKKREAVFYTRTDNLIPLLNAYQNLLGSCDENLVKDKENDGTKVSFFDADDYFFYTKGVASALYNILKAVYTDFYYTVEARKGLEVLENAIESCHHVIKISPLIITNSGPGGILANHRSNMAAPISHARFYLEVLIRILST